jgi:hypothetical protein
VAGIWEQAEQQVAQLNAQEGEVSQVDG